MEDSRRFVFQEMAILAIGEALCVGAMVAIASMLDMYDRTVLLGGIVGAVLGILNFFFMAVGVSAAADKAVGQNVKGGKATIRLSFQVRMVLLLVALFAFAKSGLCNALSMVLPIVFVRPIITVAEFFRKSGESKS